MKTQTLILIGVLSFWAGWICDGLLLPYFFVLTYAGTIVSFIGVGKWLTAKEHWGRLKEALGIGQRGNFSDMLKRAFDFSWRRVSVLWVFISIMGMIMIHGMNALFKSSDAYDAALESVKTDRRVLAESGGVLHFSDSVSGQIGRENKLNIGVIGRDRSFLTTVTLDFDDATKKYTVRSIEIY